MSNDLSTELVRQLMAQESSDPLLTLLTFSHESFDDDIRVVNNSEDIVSRGLTFLSFPFKLKFPSDDGETVRNFSLELDNVSLYFIDAIRSVTDPITVKIELILASIPDDVQISQEELKIQNLTYNAQTINANLMLDNFLNTELTSEKYGPSNFPGIF